jgi:hypothetical protein
MQKYLYQTITTGTFQGFYESDLYNSDTEYHYNKLCDDDKEYEIKDWEGFTTSVSSDITHALMAFEGREEDGIIGDYKFMRLVSPKYYNYSSDKLEIELEVDVEKLRKYCYETQKDRFNQFLADNFTSYSGFISFVPNNLVEFMADEDLDVMIEFYLLNKIDMQDYRYACSEIASGYLYQYMEPVEE